MMFKSPAPSGLRTNNDDWRKQQITDSVSDLPQEMTRDDQALDLGRAFPDLVDLGIPHIALDGIVASVPVAAMDLHGLDGRPHGHLTAVELGNGRGLAIGTPVLGEPCGMVHEVLASLDLRRHVRE